MRSLLNLIATAVVLVAAIGCDSVARDKISEEGGKALENGGKAAANAWKAAVAETEKLTQYSSQEALAAAKATLEKAYDGLQKMETPGAIDLARISTIKDQIAKIDAALTIQELRSQMDTVLRRAKAAGETVEEQRENLRKVDKGFRELDEKLNNAERGYKLAVERLQESTKHQEDLEKGVPKK